MARRGPKPASRALKILSGTRASRIPPPPVPPLVGRPEPPESLSTDPVARAEWDRLCPLLDSAGLLSRCDGAILGLYCHAASRRAQALEAVAKHGLLVSSAAGTWKPNPATSIVSAAERTMARLLSELGATPTSRGSVTRPAADPGADELRAFLGRRGRDKPGDPSAG